MSEVCREPKCVSLATVAGGLCPPHAAGYRKHDSVAGLRCAQCRGLIQKDTWYQHRDGAMFHVKSCKVHPDVMKERIEKAAQATA